MYGPYLTIAEIKAKYPNALVMLGNPTTRGRSLEPTGGYVLFHAADRAEFNRKFEEWPDDPNIKHFATLYTGKVSWDPDVIFPSYRDPGAV